MPFVVWTLGLGLLAGCRTSPPAGSQRPFVFGTDTFAYANELTWEYGYNDQGEWVARRREPAPDYALHCFVMARAARQFLDHARFQPEAGPTNDLGYRQMVQEVVSRSTTRASAEARKVAIPGFANLHEFSRAYESMLKAESGSMLQSYIQRGNWRMVFPMSGRQQERVMEEIWDWVERGRSPILHLFSFPALTINHAVLVYEARRFEDHVEFTTYDPNLPGTPQVLTFDPVRRSFHWPKSDYFPGGEVKAYVAYRDFCH